MNIYELLLAKAINGESGSGVYGGFEYEMGRVSPVIENEKLCISFANVHDDIPFAYVIQSVGNLAATTTVGASFIRYDKLIGKTLTTGSSTMLGEANNVRFWSNSLNSQGTAIISETGGSATSSSQWVSTTRITARPYSSSTPWDDESTYAWVAIWNHPAVEPIVHTYKFTGTIAQPFSADVPLDTVRNVAQYYELKTDIQFDASALGFGGIYEPFVINGSTFYSNGSDATGTANFIVWDLEFDGLVLTSAYVFVGGSSTDLTEYASLVPSNIYLFSTFPIAGLEDYEVTQ